MGGGGSDKICSLAWLNTQSCLVTFSRNRALVGKGGIVEQLTIYIAHNVASLRAIWLNNGGAISSIQDMLLPRSRILNPCSSLWISAGH